MPCSSTRANSSNSISNSNPKAEPCPIPGCSFKREQRKHLMQHMRNHHHIPLNGSKKNKKGGDMTSGRKKHAKRFDRWLRQQGYAEDVVKRCVGFFTDVQDGLESIRGWEDVALTEDEMDEDDVEGPVESGWSEDARDEDEDEGSGNHEGDEDGMSSLHTPPPTSRPAASRPRAQYGEAGPSQPTGLVPRVYITPPYHLSSPERDTGRRYSIRDEIPAHESNVVDRDMRDETPPDATETDLPADIPATAQARIARYTEDELEAADVLLMLAERPR